MTKPTYRQTFRKHRVLLTLPIVISVLVAAVFVLGSAPSYQSTASLWVDNPTSTDSSLGNGDPALIPPSTQEQNVLNELVATQSFLLTVAHKSGLAQYAAAHGSSGFSLSKLFSGGGGSVDSRILAQLGPKSIVSTIPGPQVLQIAYKGPTAALTTSTLAAVVHELQQQSDRFSGQRNDAVIAYYKAQVTAAVKAVDTARSQVGTYRAQHPRAGANDANLNALQTAAGAASSQLTDATQKLNQAAGAVRDSASNANTIQVMDPPTAAVAASGKKKQLMGIIGGLFAGALISFLGAVALTPSKPDNWDADSSPGSTAPSSVPRSTTDTSSHSSPVNGEASFVNGEASFVNGEASLVNGEASLLNGGASPVNGEASAEIDQVSPRNSSSDVAPDRLGDQPAQVLQRRMFVKATRDRS
jgi:uncharacterized protein involved in exopolysaccharide biosynthesis